MTLSNVAATRPRVPAWPLVAIAMLAVPCAQAGRPLVTDDAGQGEAKACQVDSWVRRGRTSTESWLQPACNVTDTLELSLGGARIRDDTGAVTHDRQAQAKSLITPLATNGWGVGYVVGTVSHSAAPRDFYGYVPLSRSLLDDRLLIHFNAGVLRNGLQRQTRLTWGLASEVQIAARTWLVAETYSQEAGRPFHQLGARHWLVEDRFQIDFSYGNRNGSSSQERWLSLGVRIFTPPVLP